MDIFYTIVLVIAIVTLILLLTVFGILMNNSKTVSPFPPSSNKCPDYWDYNKISKKCIHNNINNPGQKTGDIDPDDATFLSSGTTQICGQQKWANERNILWDGVSNYNKCKV